mmetsp:Transcript_25932/g.42570  ORF Transcript_25932/g.42570 Transcript_25932/m.42570 type:complete len:158 (-) Transcript_25932:149-622(-)
MELPDLGKHCELCRQLDFLPFECEGCSKLYCVEHRTRDAHKCTAPKVDSVVPTCPLCNQIFAISKSEDPNIIISKHIDAGCQSKPTETRTKSNKCSHKGCHSVELIPIRCKHCSKVYCVRHRYADVHDCGSADSLRMRAYQAAELRSQSQRKPIAVR